MFTTSLVGSKKMVRYIPFILLSPFACPFGLPDPSCLPASALHSGTAWPHILSIAALSSSDPRMGGNSPRVAISCLRPPASSSHILLNSRRRYLCRAMAHMGICHCLSDRSSERDVSEYRPRAVHAFIPSSHSILVSSSEEKIPDVVSGFSITNVGRSCSAVNRFEFDFNAMACSRPTFLLSPWFSPYCFPSFFSPLSPLWAQSTHPDRAPGTHAAA